MTLWRRSAQVLLSRHADPSTSVFNTPLTPVSLLQLRIGDVADFRGPKSEFVWVSVTVLETSPFGDVIHLSVPLTGSTFWVAVEASDQHWAPCGEKATGQLPPSSKSIPVDDAALRAAEEAAVLRILQTQKLDFRNELKRGRLLDARHKVDGLWYQVSESFSRLCCCLELRKFMSRCAGHGSR